MLKLHKLQYENSDYISLNLCITCSKSLYASDDACLDPIFIMHFVKRYQGYAPESVIQNVSSVPIINIDTVHGLLSLLSPSVTHTID